MAREKAPKAPTTESGIPLSGVPRVNLLPASEVARRDGLRLTKRWVAGLAASLILVTIAIGVAVSWRTMAEFELTLEQERTLDLNTDLGALAKVSRVLADQDTLTKLRASAMANDAELQVVLKQIEGALPKGATLQVFDMIGGANPISGEDPGAAPGALARVVVATDDPADQYRMVASLRALETVLAAEAGVVASEDSEHYSFAVGITFDQSHYTGRHTKEAVR